MQPIQPIELFNKINAERQRKKGYQTTVYLVDFGPVDMEVEVRQSEQYVQSLCAVFDDKPFSPGYSITPQSSVKKWEEEVWENISKMQNLVINKYRKVRSK